MHFKLKLENELKYAFFFKGDTDKEEDYNELDEDDLVNRGKKLMKKNYIIVTKDGDVIIKNLGLRKKSNSELSKRIFFDYLVSQIKEGKIKFSKQYIKNLITQLLKEDITLIAMRKDVDVFERYEKSETGIYAQISKKYGEGIHFMVPNLKGLGVGKGKSLCTIEEFKEHNLRIEDIDLSNVWNELDYFIEPVQVKTIFDFGTEEK